MKILLCDIDEICKAMYTNSCKCVSKNAYNNLILVKFGQFKRYLPKVECIIGKIFEESKTPFFQYIQQNNV